MTQKRVVIYTILYKNTNDTNFQFHHIGGIGILNKIRTKKQPLYPVTFCIQLFVQKCGTQCKGKRTTVAWKLNLHTIDGIKF